MFFKDERNIRSIESFINITQNYDSDDKKLEKLLKTSHAVMRFMLKDPEFWQQCTYNINKNGDEFIKLLMKVHDDNINSEKTAIRIAVVDCFSFLYEMNITLDGKNEHDQLIKNYFYEFYNEIDLDDGNELNPYLKEILDHLPARIIGHYLHHKKMDAFLDFASKAKEVEDKKNEYLEDINNFAEIIDKQFKDIENLKNALKRTKHAFNFAGLFQGFSDLHETKKGELRWQRSLLIAMSILIPVPLLFSFFFKSSPTVNLIELIPIASLEIILLYYFRIILVNYRSSKTQIMQIELRQTICKFIQHYAEFVSDIKANNDKVSLDKFENLIFSGILSDNQKLPATFDGISQIGDLVKSLKGSK